MSCKQLTGPEAGTLAQLSQSDSLLNLSDKNYDQMDLGKETIK